MGLGKTNGSYNCLMESKCKALMLTNRKHLLGTNVKINLFLIEDIALIWISGEIYMFYSIIDECEGKYVQLF